MIEGQLPPGLVLWPDAEGAQIAVLLSDIHCTDCTVGNQTVGETDWECFFHELRAMLQGMIPQGKTTQVLIILNGDVVDVLRSSRWVESGVYPWDRDDPQFLAVLTRIMEGIIAKHAQPPKKGGSSGFFYFLQQLVSQLAPDGQVQFIPILGNHDKEVQLYPEIRQMYYRDCLGLADSGEPFATYAVWANGQMSEKTAPPVPYLPAYFASRKLRLFATHGQWRDDTNSTNPKWRRFHDIWRPAQWRKENYKTFTDACFGDTIATGLVSRFIYRTTEALIENFSPQTTLTLGAQTNPPPGPVEHICNILCEMDLYRPSVAGVVRLLDETAKLDRSKTAENRLKDLVLAQFNDALDFWLGTATTWATAPWRYRYAALPVVWLFSRLNIDLINRWLMKLLASVADGEENLNAEQLRRLPGFLNTYRPLGFRLHVEGHTHAATENDIHFSRPPGNPNYSYINLGAWRDRILPKVGKGYRRRGTGRALIVQGGDTPSQFNYTLRDITSWGSRLDRW